MPLTTIAVRALCEFTAKEGDLDLRFTPSPTAADGQRGHVLVASRRGPGYRREVALSATCGDLLVRGRADGYEPALRRVEEIKTHRGRLDRQPANHRRLHWAQAMVYGWMLCRDEGLAEIELALVYLDIASLEETVFAQTLSADALRLHFERLCAAYAHWAATERAHRAARDAALAAMRFPQPAFRRGQRPLAEAVYKAVRAGRCLLAEAPTGIGKTLGTLFPALKAAAATPLPGEAGEASEGGRSGPGDPGGQGKPTGLDRVFYLTAKSSGRALALDALAALREAGTAGSASTASTAARAAAAPSSAIAWPLRVLELSAREKACEHPGLPCDGAVCPLARGFYDRLPAAREAALAEPAWDLAAVRRVALAHGVCPYWLGQELARWSDVVVGDYNHFFDANALLHGLVLQQEWRAALLIDEAHNLIGRAREMYSAEIEHAAIAGLKKRAPAPLVQPLARVLRRWSELDRGQPEGYRVLGAAPAPLLAALQQCSTAIDEWLASEPGLPDPALLELHFAVLRLLRLAESFGEHSMFEAERGPGRRRIALRNLVPAPHLAPRFAAAHAAVLFSATLRPHDFHRELLGLPKSLLQIEIDAPFEPAQLQVRVEPISTRFARRQASVAPIVGCIARQMAARPGNYLAFFSSYAYLDAVAERFAALHPELPLWRQSRGMAEGEQAGFLARFVVGGHGVGFAVLGGAFAEGIDLPGERLVGAFIATLGLPQMGEQNEAMRMRIDALMPGNGFDYTYLFPGLQKVVQAAGRVIRTPDDRGSVHLLDERYREPRVRRLLPRWWPVAIG